MFDPNWPPPPAHQPDGMSTKLDTAALGYGKYIRREEWGAAAPRRVTKHALLPVGAVVAVWAGVEPCSTEDECKQRARELQQRHMRKPRMSDIEHHFLVGGDGNIYEGRGWSARGPTYPKQLKYAEELTGRSIEIAILDKHSSTLTPMYARQVDLIIMGGASFNKTTCPPDLYFRDRTTITKLVDIEDINKIVKGKLLKS